MPRGQHPSRDISSPKLCRSGSTSMCRKPSSAKWPHNSDLDNGASGVVGPWLLLFPGWGGHSAWELSSHIAFVSQILHGAGQEGSGQRHDQQEASGTMAVLFPVVNTLFVGIPSLLSIFAICTAVVMVCLIPLLSGVRKFLFQTIISPLLSLLPWKG